MFFACLTFHPPFCTRKYFKKFIPPSYLTKRPRHLKFGVDLTDPAKLVFQLIAWLDKVCIYSIIQQKQKKKQKKNSILKSSNNVKDVYKSQELNPFPVWPGKIKSNFVQIEKVLCI